MNKNISRLFTILIFVLNASILGLFCLFPKEVCTTFEANCEYSSLVTSLEYIVTHLNYIVAALAGIILIQNVRTKKYDLKNIMNIALLVTIFFICLTLPIAFQFAH